MASPFSFFSKLMSGGSGGDDGTAAAANGTPSATPKDGGVNNNDNSGVVAADGDASQDGGAGASEPSQKKRKLNPNADDDKVAETYEALMTMIKETNSTLGKILPILEKIKDMDSDGAASSSTSNPTALPAVPIAVDTDVAMNEESLVNKKHEDDISKVLALCTRAAAASGSQNQAQTQGQPKPTSSPSAKGAQGTSGKASVAAAAPAAASSSDPTKQTPSPTTSTSATPAKATGSAAPNGQQPSGQYAYPATSHYVGKISAGGKLVGYMKKEKIDLEQLLPYEIELTPTDASLMLSSVDGFETQVKFLRESFLFSVLNKDALQKRSITVPRKLLFHGGEYGSMLLVKALRNELSKIYDKPVRLFARTKGDVFGRYSMEAEDMVRNLFLFATKTKPSIIFIEEYESLVHYCNLMGPTSILVSLLSSEFRKLSKTPDVFVIFSCKTLKKITPTLKQEFDHFIEFPEVSHDAWRKSLIINETKDWAIPPTEEIISHVVQKTEEFACVQIEQACKEAMRLAIVEMVSSREEGCCKKCNSDTKNLKLDDHVLDLISPSKEDWDTAVDNILKKSTSDSCPPTSFMDDLDRLEKKLASSSASSSISTAAAVDESLSFLSVGGLEEQITYLKENVIVPFQKKDILKKWGVEPIRGIIFHGPPGTGKTLLAKALASELSRLEVDGKKFSFFYHKATDCFNMYVGETEKALRTMFSKAEASSPAILFFDEIDGLCHKRVESGNARFHGGVVTTMLSLLDNVKRGELLVIAATNRLDNLDPAIRRPGRFDKTVAFHPPNEEGRKTILEIHTKQWINGREPEILERMSRKCMSWSGADLEQLCRQTFVVAMRRNFSIALASGVTDPAAAEKKLEKDDCKEKKEADPVEPMDELKITEEDWNIAYSAMRPSNLNVFGNEMMNFNKPPMPSVTALLSKNVKEIGDKLALFLGGNGGKDGDATLKSFLIWGKQRKDIDFFLIPTLIAAPFMKSTVPFCLDIASGDMTKSKIDSIISQVLTPAEGKMGVLYLPRIDKWQELATLHGTMKDGSSGSQILEHALKGIGSLRGENAIILGTSDATSDKLPPELSELFQGMDTMHLHDYAAPTKEDYEIFFANLEAFPTLLERAVAFALDKEISINIKLLGELDLVKNKFDLDMKDKDGNTADMTEDAKKSVLSILLKNAIDNMEHCDYGQCQKLDMYT